MSFHRITWFVAVLAAFTAALILTARNAGERADEARVGLTEPVTEALALLEADPAMERPETRAKVRAAADEFKRSASSSAKGYFLLGLCRMEDRQFVAAEQAFRRAISLDPKWSRPYNSLGILLANHAADRAEEAEWAFRMSIRLDPEWSRPHNDLAILLRILERLDEAEQEALQALRLAPADVAAHNNYGNLLTVQGRYAEAERHYVEAIRLNPEHPKPYYNLGCLFALQNNLEKALLHLEKSFALDGSLRQDALTDPDLNGIRGDRRFQALLVPSTRSPAS